MNPMSKIKSKNVYKIFEIIRRKGPISRANLAKITGLTRGTVSCLTKEMIDSGYIKESSIGNSKKGKGGRKPILLTLKNKENFFIGVDAHWDMVSLAIADINGQIIFNDSYGWEGILSPEEYFEKLEQAIFKIINENELNEKIKSIGISMSGVIDNRKYIVRCLGHMNWPMVNVQEYLKNLNLPIFIDNRTSSSLVAETWLHHDIFPENATVFFMNVIEGIGGALMVDGHLLKNNNNSVGEIGHNSISFNGRNCYCGRKGCLETYVSDKVFVHDYSERIGEEFLIDKNIRKTSEKIMEKALSNDSIAIEILSEASKKISVGLCNVINFIAPKFIIIGGTITKAWKIIEPIINEEVKNNSIEKSLDGINIRKSFYNDKSGLYGGIAIAIQEFMKKYT